MSGFKPNVIMQTSTFMKSDKKTFKTGKEEETKEAIDCLVGEVVENLSEGLSHCLESITLT